MEGLKPFTGRVVQGKRLGRTLGFPTANLETDDARWPRGVYAVIAETESGRYKAVMNVGAHPTLPEGPPTIEAHLIDFSGDLYGQTLRIVPVRFLRGERRFGSPEALKRQLALDRDRAREIISL